MKRLMRHYSINTIVALCLTVLLFSCGSDDEGSNNDVAKISQRIQTEWYAPEAARYMKFENMQVSGMVYQSLWYFPEIVETFSGWWAYYSQGGVLSLDIVYEESLTNAQESYNVLQCDDTTLKVRLNSLGLTLTFYKIVEIYKSRIGDQFDIEYAKSHSDFSTASYTSSSTNFAHVDRNGHVTVTGGGPAFITVSSAAGTVVVRVDGGQRIDSYTAEIAETIDQVIARHGEPDLTQELTTGTVKAIYNKSEKIIDSAVIELAYIYDPDSREVSSLEFRYGRLWFWDDQDYIKRVFYPYLDNKATYAPSQILQENHFFVEITRAEKQITIYNLDYYAKHGHY